MKQGFNPILPLDEYIPDGEPHVFGDRIYLFGSHDTEGGTRYCAEGNYVGWSAPLENPTEWEYHGVIYEAAQDPDFTEGSASELYAPDVVCGNDGRYYLYYNITGSAGSSGHNICKVAVSDSPTGKYEYLGYVRNADGSVHNTYLMGDPGAINDDGTIRLYYGWSLSMVAAEAHKAGKGYAGEEPKLSRQEQLAAKQENAQMPLFAEDDTRINQMMAPVFKMMFARSPEQLADLKYPLMGANTVELCDDMMTVKGEPKRIVPGQFNTPKDSSFFGHAFYEAASIRKINGTYYFIYSSENSNELCYATSKYPDRDFVYGGTIISNGDVGYQGLTNEERHNQTANDHGSLECINGQWYIFHHRQTHRSTFSRQACAEKVVIKEDGSIEQVECTSMGLNGGALMPEGHFPAPISCILTNGKMPHITNTMIDSDIPHITHNADENGEIQRFITGIKNGTRIGYKYFEFDGTYRLTLTVRGNGTGNFTIKTENEKLAVISFEGSKEWTEAEVIFSAKGILPLYFEFTGEGNAQLLEFAFTAIETKK